MANSKLFVFLLFVLLFVYIDYSLGESYYQAKNTWVISDSCSLSFNQEASFSNVPSYGVCNDSNLVGYWNFNEDSGVLIGDSSGQNNTGTLVNSPSWVVGKYGTGISFANGGYAKISNSPSINISKAITVSMWIEANNIGKYGQIIQKEGSDVYSGVYSLRVDTNNNLTVRLSQTGSIIGATTTKQINSTNTWYHVAFTYDGISKLTIYVNGISVPYYQNAQLSGSIDTSSKPLLIGQRETGDFSFDGVIDDVHIYNRSLSASEISALSIQPDPAFLSNYSNFQDAASNNTMLIYMIPNENSSPTVNCTEFFTNNKLKFEANDSLTLNIWTNLGKPVYSTGSWNNDNFTTTLLLNAYCAGELVWGTTTAPSVSNISTSLNLSGNYTVFSSFWNDNQSLSHGGHIFSTNNTGQWVNATWSPFETTPDWGNITIMLNETVGLNIGFREYANNSLNIWGDSGIYLIKTTAIYIANSSPAPTPETLITPTPTPRQINNLNPKATNTSTASTPAPLPTALLAQNPENNNFFSNGPLIDSVAIGALLSVLALVFKKGNVKIKVVDEEFTENPSEEDYTI